MPIVTSVNNGKQQHDNAKHTGYHHLGGQSKPASEQIYKVNAHQ